MKNPIERIRQCGMVGLVLGGGWSLLIGGLTLMTGSAMVPHRRGETPLYQLVLVLIIGGLIAGVIAGALLPLAKRKAGAAVVGVIALAPYLSALAWTRQQRFEPVPTIMTILIVGVMAGLIFHRIFTEEETAGGAEG